MSKLLHALTLLILVVADVTGANLIVKQAGETPQVFPGRRELNVFVENSSPDSVESKLRWRLYQANSGSIMPLGTISDWKTTLLLPGQTILESIQLDFPNVRSETSFELRLLDEDNKVIGQIHAEVFPTNLLKQISLARKSQLIGVIDPESLLKPLLKNQGVSFEDLDANAGFDSFEGRLVIIGPFSDKAAVPDGLRKRLLEQCSKPFAFVWIQPPNRESKDVPPIYVVKEGASAFAIVNAQATQNLATSPKSQHNLLQAVRLALKPDLLALPIETQTP